MGYHDSTGRYRQTQTTQIDLPAATWFEVDGTPLAAFADAASPTPGLALDNSEAAGIRWNNHANPDPVCRSLLVPLDKAPDTDMVVHILASKTGATVGDATTFDVGAFFNTAGALRDADANAGGVTAALDGDAATKTVQHVTRTIAAADIPNTQQIPETASPTRSRLTLTLQPTDGTLGTDDVTVEAWVEYERIVTPD